ncbi:MAG: FHA domain-containing protein [Candidatus Eremiobacteraeota bacterium]|nr:FHA domain-containing protein [Candidatus Eremiobacteraeota bacterium]
MTYMKRFAFHVLMLVVGGGLAIMMLNLAGKHMVVPAALSYVIIALFMALCLAVSQLWTAKLFPFPEQETLTPMVRKQTWAWLRPGGDSTKSGFPLNKDHIVVGREVKCHIMLNDNSVSRQHSSVTRLAEGYLLKDLGSSNGTYVNGHRIQEALLKDGDRISIGDCEFWFEAPSDGGSQPAVGMGALPREGGAQPAEMSSGGGFCLDPSAPGDFEEEDDEGTEAWHPRPGDL